MSDDANEPEVDILINGKFRTINYHILSQVKKHNQVLSHLNKS